MGEQFSAQIQAIFELARQEAGNLNHYYVGTEHLLLALLQGKTGLSGDALKMLGLDADKVRHEVERMITRGPEAVSTDKLPFTPRAQRVIEYGQQEAMLVNQKQMSGEHLLLGLFREPDGVAAKVLENLGLKLTEIRREVLKTRLAQMKLVESVVRPIRAGAARKRKMREELLAHLEAIYAEEKARLNDPELAMREAAKRFGGPAELSLEFQRSLSGSDRIGYRMERWFGWRAPESAMRYMLRQSLQSCAIIAAVVCIPAIAMLLAGANITAWREMRPLIAALLLTPLDQLLLGILYFKMRDALCGAYWTHKSPRKALLLDVLIAAVVIASGFAFKALAEEGIQRGVEYLPIFSAAGLLAAWGYHHLARSRGPAEISDTYWACLKLE